MDLGLHTDPQESYRLFQGRLLEEYERLVEEFGLVPMDATLPVEKQQRMLREAIRPHLNGLRRADHSPPLEPPAIGESAL